MSRSFKKHPFKKDNGGSAKWVKTHSNRLFRRHKALAELHAGKSAVHRRYTDPTDRHDGESRFTRVEAEREWDTEERLLKSGEMLDRHRFWGHQCFRTKKQMLDHWAKHYRRK